MKKVSMDKGSLSLDSIGGNEVQPPPPLSMPVLSEAEGWRGDEESAY